MLRRAAQLCRAGLQFLFKELSDPRSHFVSQPKLFFSGVEIVVRLQSAAWLVRICTQKTKDRPSQFSGIFLQVIKKIDAKQLWTNVAFPARDDFTGMRSQKHSGIQQIPNYVIRIGCIEGADVSKSRPSITATMLSQQDRELER